MKNTLVSFAAFLVAVFCLLSWVDKSEYAVEKKLWYIQKKMDAISVDPSVVPDKPYDDIILRYTDIINKYPDSALLPKVYFKIAQTYGLKREFDKSREVLERIAELYPDNKDLNAEVLLNIGRTYEIDGNAPEALGTYHRIQDELGPTDIGLNMPLYIVNYYSRAGKTEEAKRALSEAVSIYRSIVRDNPQSERGHKALVLLVSAYSLQGSWELALSSLANILLDYPTGDYLNIKRANVLAASINSIAISRLDSYEKAIDIYQKFIDQNPKHGLNQYFLMIINKLSEELKLKKEALENKNK